MEGNRNGMIGGRWQAISREVIVFGIPFAYLSSIIQQWRQRREAIDGYRGR
jgi:hypothetical protein